MPSPSSALLIDSGLSAVGPVRWGAHLCHFSGEGQRDDVERSAVGYFVAGLAANERCVWVTPDRSATERAREALARVVPDLAARETAGQLRICSREDVYGGPGGARGLSVVDYWLGQERSALAAGYAGLRIAGDVTWLEAGDLPAFLEYEHRVQEAFHDRRIVALCLYSLGGCGVDHLSGVLGCHDHGMVAADGALTRVDSAVELHGLFEPEAERATERGPARAFAATDPLATDEPEPAGRALAVLQYVTSALSRAVTVRDVADVVTNAVARALCASRAVTVQVTDGALFEVVAASGIAERDVRRHIRTPVGAHTPMADAYRSGDAVWLRTREEIDARYPALPRALVAMAALPLVIAGERIGAVGFGFRRAEAFTPARRALIHDVVHQAALALERARLYERAEQASRAKDEFLAMLGHELRNPLAPIASGLELLRAPGSPDPAVLDAMERQLGHAKRLVDDLLDVSRATRGKLSVEPRPIDLRPVIGEAMAAVQGLMEERRHRVHAALPDAPLVVNGDADRLHQVVVNLLANAARYTPPGGAIELEARSEDDRVVILVRDDGQGIDPALLPHLFEPFAQGPRGLDRRDGGLGIGLMIVRTIARLHGGEVAARSEGPGRGSEFEVALPRCADAPTEPGLGRAPSPAVAPTTVLIVDDNEDAATLTAALLRRAGHDVWMADDGPAALAAIERERPAVAVLDIGLPGMDGYALARAVRARWGDDAPRLVALTGYGADRDRAAAAEAGFDVHLVKPVTSRALGEALRTLAAPR